MTLPTVDLSKLPNDPLIARPATAAERESLRKVILPISPEERERLLAPVRREAQRLKERRSSVPFYAASAAMDGEEYWMKLAASYGGS
jgi:hypothetical protein